jgi:DNA-binding beta-propeller fold protein YncE
MDRSTARIAFTALTIGFIVLLGGCMDASLSQSGSAPASISIQDAPSAIPVIDLSITGGGANISETVGPGTDALVFELPVGQEHEVTIDTTNFIGRESFTLPPGGAQVDVQMLEKLLVPDNTRGEVISIDGMGGNGWNAVSIAGVLEPSDVEIGPEGRVYVVNRFAAALVRLDALDATPVTLIDDTDPQVDGQFSSLAIDDANRLIYVLGGDSDGVAVLLKLAFDGSIVDFYAGEPPVSDLIDFGFSGNNFPGIAAGPDGAVFIAAAVTGDPATFSVKRFNPSSDTTEWVTEIPSSSTFRFTGDVTYNGNTLYVANALGPDGYKIVALDPATGEIVDHFGSYPADPENPSSGDFYAPRRFVAVGNRKITVIDEEELYPDLRGHRLVQFNPGLGGSGWSTYGSEGGGEGEFEFFFFC